MCTGERRGAPELLGSLPVLDPPSPRTANSMTFYAKRTMVVKLASEAFATAQQAHNDKLRYCGDTPSFKQGTARFTRAW
jgi:hypothetical protein